MPRPLAEYDLADWSRLRPLTHTLKSWRYRLIDRMYRRQPPRAGELAAVRAAVRGRQVLTTVAFDDPETIAWQAALVRHYVPHALYLIADNSVEAAAAEAIAAVARRTGAPYLRLPDNPWDAGSRSHGLALNWIWHNVLRPGAPAAFGFLDDDIFPTTPDDPFAPLSTQDFYGVVRTAGARWFLWAGLCVFNFASVRDKPLDFGQDWFIGLDTGGGNWRTLFCQADRAALREIPSRWVAFKPEIDLAAGPLQWCGAWLHEVGMMGEPELAREKRAAVAAILAPYLAAAGAGHPSDKQAPSMQHG